MKDVFSSKEVKAQLRTLTGKFTKLSELAEELIPGDELQKQIQTAYHAAYKGTVNALDLTNVATAEPAKTTTATTTTATKGSTKGGAAASNKAKGGAAGKGATAKGGKTVKDDDLM